MKAKRFTAVSTDILYEGEYDNHELEVVLAAEAEAEMKAAFARLRGEVSRHRERAEAAERELQRLEDCIREYEGRACCTKWINNARHRPECHWAAAERERVKALEAWASQLAELAEAKAELAQAREALHDAEREYDNLKEGCHDVLLSLNAATKERDEARRQLANALLDIAQADRELHETQALLAEYTRQPPTTLDVARAELAQAKAEIERLERERDHEA